ncbi:MAG: hypothetical protein OEV55_01300 [candidate division Zixibacteria bacterium]|nr:hypothetical protein [candidate division Zixibacteria bacterium]
MTQWKDYLKPADWEIVTRAPGSFFLAGEHAVMFGHPAVCQSLPKYFYVGVRRRLHDEKVNVDIDNIYFVDVLDPKQKRREFVFPSIIVSCQLEHLLTACGWKGVDIGLYSELPSMCGLGSSGALAASLSLALNYQFENNFSRKELDSFLEKLSKPTRTIEGIIKDPIFSKCLFPLAWGIDSLFHNHQSSGANAFFSLIGAPDGLPSYYLQTIPRKGDLDDPPKSNFNPSRIFSKNMLCSDFKKSPKPTLSCPKENICPDFYKIYSYYTNFPYEAKSLAEDYPNAGCDLFDFSCALVYSGKLKTTEAAIRGVKARMENFGNYLKKVNLLNLTPDMSHDIFMTYLGSISEELWAALGSYFSARDESASNIIINIIGYSQSALRNLLGLSTEWIDTVVQKANLNGFGAKLTGGGTGGDVVVVCKSREWDKLCNYLKELEQTKDSLFSSHFEGRWFTRNLACSPTIEKRGAFRFLLALDIKNSGLMRKKEGDEKFDVFSKKVEDLAVSYGGQVLAYHKTDDQRFVAFEKEEQCEKYKANLNDLLNNAITQQCYIDFLETPFDWSELKNLEPSAEQSKSLSDLVHKLKTSKDYKELR